MRRKVLSDDKIKEIIELCQSGASWLKIQKATGVERRLAKRTYNDWLRDRTLSELKQARVNVATEAFSDHVDSLLKLAEGLTNHLNVPTPSRESRYGKDVLRNFLETNILGEFYELSQVDEDRKRRRNYRRNLILLKSLQEHTSEKVRWQALAEWEKAWDSCRGLFDELEVKGQKVVMDRLNQENDLLQWIKEHDQEEKIIKWMEQLVLDTIWEDILKGKLDLEHPKVSILYQWVGARAPSSAEKEWIERLRNICLKLAEILLKDETILFGQLYDEAHTLRKTIEECEEMLDPLILRPMVLLTPRCDLCPA